MLTRFKDYITQQHLFSPGEEVLLAVSGGRDSVCMAHALATATATRPSSARGLIITASPAM